MRTFILKVTTRQNFDDEEHFAGALEDLIPWFYSEVTEMVEEKDFERVIVLQKKPKEFHALGGSQ